VRQVELDDTGEHAGQPLFLVCTHGKHDPCCARYGRPLFEGLAEQVDEQWVWQTTHVGGDRFAGNLVCLPHGLYYGRVSRAEAATLLDEHLEGRIQLDRYRGRSAYSFPVQAAERSVREDEGLVGIAELRLSETRRGGDRLRVEFEGADGRRHVRVVFAEDGDPAFLTCGAAELRRPRRFIAHRVEERRS
jgi:(2Fe-2S) ferredoxin